MSIRFVVAAVSGVLLLLGAAVGASANPSATDKRAQAEAILTEIHALDEQVGDAAERFNGANYELQKVTVELKDAREDLTRARQLQKLSQRRIAARLRELYVNGDEGSSIDVIVGAQSLDELLDRLELARRVAAQDALIAREAKALRERVAKREAELTAARARQAVVVEQRAVEKRAIEGKLAERRRLLASVEDEIAQLEEAERRHQAELRRQAEQELERQRRAADAQAKTGQAAEQTAAPTQASPVDGDGFSGPAPGTDYTPPPPDAAKAAQVVAIAMQYLGVPYKWGGASPETGFDCSGLTMYVFAQIGVSLPHYAAAQYRMGVPVPKDQLQPGDLVFFRALGHMGMYIGGGNFIHAPRTGDVVKISPLSDPYYVRTWVGARRVL